MKEEEKVERKTQQCLDGLSRVIEKTRSGPNMKEMFLQVLGENHSDFVFWEGERNGKRWGRAVLEITTLTP